jgi:hypothetical protein
LRRHLLLAASLSIGAVHAAFAGSGGKEALLTTSAPPAIGYVPGSVKKLCQVTGDTDLEYGRPTLSLTQTRYGLVRADHGYSFEHDGRLFFLFGDTHPAPKFNGFADTQTDSPRIADDNDAIGFVADTAAGPCLKLDFVTDAIGAYRNPVVLDAQGVPAIRLRTNESPISGISDGGRMFVMFGTDNPIDTVTPPAPLGYPRRSVVAVSDDDGNTFHFLYNFSAEPQARFINTAIARGQDGYLYFWGTQGDSLYRKSPSYLARKAVGTMSDSASIRYLHSVQPDGSPVFLPGETGAVPLFHDSLPGPGGVMQTADGMGELGVEWNPFVHSWVMLYNCTNNTPANPRGIYMRTAPNPWGPWSVPQTIFNPERDNGYCFFMHRAVTLQNPAPCDSLSGADRMAEAGGDYGPYFISRFTTGDSVKGTSTFYFTMDTWNPYTQVVMQASVRTASGTGIAVAVPPVLQNFTLDQNFPNPFNPATGIRYAIPSALFVTLKVYDVTGREVATLVRGEKPAGSYEVQFNPTDLASGVYFYRLQAGNFSRSRMMLLVR